MLTALRIGNFKAFVETQRVPIRPLTFLYGANSAGKSSIIHGLVLARHVLDTGELEIHRTVVGGESVDLGGFRQYVHRREVGRRMEWSIALIDPHLVYRTSLRNLEFRRALSVIDDCAVPGGRHSRLSVVEIHARVDRNEAVPDDRYEGVARLIQPAMPRVVAACPERWLRVWRPRPEGKPFHNRRILTNHAGLSCPWGLDVHDAGEAGDDEWALLDYEDRVAISADFQRNTSPYELVVEVPW